MNRKLLGLLLLLPIFLMGTSIMVRKSAPTATRQDPPKKIVVERATQVRSDVLTTRTSRPVESTTASQPCQMDDFADDVRRCPLVRHSELSD